MMDKDYNSIPVNAVVSENEDPIRQEMTSRLSFPKREKQLYEGNNVIKSHKYSSIIRDIMVHYCESKI